MIHNNAGKEADAIIWCTPSQLICTVLTYLLDITYNIPLAQSMRPIIHPPNTITYWV